MIRRPGSDFGIQVGTLLVPVRGAYHHATPIKGPLRAGNIATSATRATRLNFLRLSFLPLSLALSMPMAGWLGLAVGTDR